MKLKFIAIVLYCCMLGITVYAASSGVSSQYPRVLILGRNFELKFSNCSQNSQNCLNEYYRLKEKDYGWTELFTLHSLKSVNDVNRYATMLYSANEHSSMEYNKLSNEAIVGFIIPYKDNASGKVFLEQNIFRILKAPSGNGLVALQYACRLPYGTYEEQLESYKKAKSNHTRVLNELNKMKVPALYQKPLQNW